MIQATEKARKIELEKEGVDFQKKDIIIEMPYYEEEVDKDGNVTRKRKVQKTNLTKQITETAKLIKQNLAEEKLEEIKKIFTN